MFYADLGSNWYVTGSPNAGWDDNALNDLKGLKGSDFEAVDESAYMVSPDSALAALPIKKPKPKSTTPGRPWPPFK